MPEALALVYELAEVAAVSAAEAVGISGTALLTVAAAADFALSAGASLALSATLNAVLAPSIPSPEAARQQVKQSIPPRQRGYGRARLSGPVALDVVNANVLYRVLQLHDGLVDGYETYYLNDDLVTVAGGVVQKMASDAYPTGFLKIETRLGEPTETAYASLVGERPEIWTNSHRGDGIASAYFRCENGKLEYFARDYPNGKPNLSIITRLSPVFDWRDPTQNRADPTTWKWSTNAIVCWVHELWVHRGPDYDWNRRFAPVLDILTAEADVCDQPIDVIKVRGEITDWAEAGSTSAGFSTVAGLAIGSTFQIGNPSSEHTVTAIEGSNVRFEPDLGADHQNGSVVVWSVAAGMTVTEPRYQVAGVYSCDARLADVITSFKEACDGFMARRGDGAIILRCGHFDELTVTIGANEVIDFSWQSYVERERACNSLDVRYVSPAHAYNQVQTDAWQDLDDISTVGELRSQPFSPGWVQWNSQVRRLAKRKLGQMMVGTGTIRVRLSGLRALGQRYIRVQLGADEIDELADAVVEIYDAPQINEDGLSVTFPIRMADPNVDAWNAETEEGEGPPVPGGSISNQALTAPTITAASAFFGDVSNGASGVRIAISATGPDRQDLTWSSRWRVTGAASWRENTDTSAVGAVVVLDTDFVPTETSIDVEVAYQTGGGTLSPWSETSVVSSSTAAAGPNDPTALAATGGVGEATLTWRNSTSANFDHVVLSRGATAVFGAAAPIGAPIAGAAGAAGSYADPVAAGAYYWWVTAYNAAGTASNNVGPVSAVIT